MGVRLKRMRMCPWCGDLLLNTRATLTVRVGFYRALIPVHDDDLWEHRIWWCACGYEREATSFPIGGCAAGVRKGVVDGPKYRLDRWRRLNTKEEKPAREREKDGRFVCKGDELLRVGGL